MAALMALFLVPNMALKWALEVRSFSMACCSACLALLGGGLS